MQLLQMDHWRQDDHHPRSFPNKEICWVGETFFFLTNSWQGYWSPPSQLSYPIKGFLPWPTSKIVTVKINVQCLDVNKNDPK